MNTWWQRCKYSTHMRYSGWLLQGLHRMTFWGDKFKQRFSPLGMGLMLALLITMMFGANMKTSSIYQLFSLLVGLFLVSLLAAWVFSKTHKKVLHMQRELPQFVTVNIPSFYRMEVKNTAKESIYALRIGEIFKLPKPSLSDFLQRKEPHEEKRNWYDRHTGYYRFVWLQHELRGAVFIPQTLATLEPEEVTSCQIHFTPLRRGFIHLNTLRAYFPEPLGVLYVFEDHLSNERLLVLPKAYRLPASLILGGKRSYQHEGVSQILHAGESEEFSGLREYRDGDSQRHIFWPSLARSAKPLVKEYQDEYYTRAALVLDNFASDAKQEIFEEAISVAAGFATQVETQDLLLDLMFVGEQGKAKHMLANGKILADAEHMLESLATLQISHGSFAQLGQMVLQQTQRLSGCVLILLAWDEARQHLVKQLRSASVPVRVLLILAQDEPAPKEDVLVLRMGNIQQDLDDLA